MTHPTRVRTAVVIPVYQARYLDECLASVFAQTYAPDEVIVVDDGSPDREAIDRVIQRYDAIVRMRREIRLLRQENAGAGAARNYGILSTDAELVAFLDADDLWAPSLLETLVAHLRDTPDVDLVYANGLHIGDGPLVGTQLMDGAPSVGPVTVEALLAQRCTVFTSSTVVRRRALVEVGLFDEDLRRGQDFDLWVRLASLGKRIEYLTDALMMRRVHQQNLSGDRVSELERAAAVLMKLSTKLRLSECQRDVLDRQVRTLTASIDTEHGKRSLARGDLADAQVRFSRAARARAGWKSQLVHLGLTVAPSFTRQLYLRW